MDEMYQASERKMEPLMLLTKLYVSIKDIPNSAI